MRLEEAQKEPAKPKARVRITLQETLSRQAQAAADSTISHWPTITHPNEDTMQKALVDTKHTAKHACATSKVTQLQEL